MRPKDFYNFCKNNRVTEPDPHKEQALRAVYNFMFECSNSKESVTAFIQQQIAKCKDDMEIVEAYEWLMGILEGTVPCDETIVLVPVQGSEA